VPGDFDPLIGKQLGSWRVEDRISLGGQGEVYRAQRVEGGFDQTVAIKVLHTRSLSPLAATRFQEEQEILAGLSHPHIVNLLGTGYTSDGRAWLAMEYVEGKPIDIFANEQALSITQRLRLFLKVCQTVAYAHRNLVIHLDLKPSNILVTREGEPKLLDFGLARRLRTGQDGVMRGPMTAFSLPYASPEQVTPGGAVSTVSDVYSLGAVLYELLTGHTPLILDLLSEQAMIHAICEQVPLTPSIVVSRSRFIERPGAESYEFSPSKLSAMRGVSTGELRRELRGDLDNLLLVSLHKEPHRRYPSVEEMARDMERYLDGKSVRAKASSPAYVAFRGARKYPMRVLACALVVSFSLANRWLPAFYRKGAQETEQDTAAIRAVNCSAGNDLRANLLPALSPGLAEQRFKEALEQMEINSDCASFHGKDR
jgi:eukaryotic-like serine/threonine-protein kinase